MIVSAVEKLRCGVEFMQLILQCQHFLPGQLQPRTSCKVMNNFCRPLDEVVQELEGGGRALLCGAHVVLEPPLKAAVCLIALHQQKDGQVAIY